MSKAVRKIPVAEWSIAGKSSSNKSEECQPSSDISKKKWSDKDVSNNRKTGNEVKETDVSNLERTDDCLDEDISAFGFGGNFASELVSGSPIAVSNISDKSSKSKDSTKKNKSLRRGTFVMSAPADSSVSGEGTDVEKTGKVNGDSSSVNRTDKSGAKAKSKQDRRQTYAAENPFVSKSKKVMRSPVKRTDEKILDDFNSVKDPFKPTKTLLRSPPPVSDTKCDKDKDGGNRPEATLDSHTFLATFKKSLNALPINNSPLPEPTFPDEPTTYFNTDMEFTTVIDTASFLQGFTNANTNKVSPNIPAVTVEETCQDTEAPQVKSSTTKGKTKTTTKEKNGFDDCDRSKLSKSEAQVEKHTEDVAAVEVRTKKPGVFTFSVSRKEADGTRKPVPENQRARSKKKQAVPSAMLDEPAKTGDDRDMFNFGDRTPTMPLEKLPKSVCHNVYDLSMTENSQCQAVSLNNLRDKQDTNKSDKILNPKLDEHIYYLPLKGSPDEKPVMKRSRSKSNTRSKSRTRCSDSEDEDLVPGSKRSKSRARSRGRSVGRRKDDTVQGSDGVSPKTRSRPRKVEDKELELESIKVQPRRSTRSKSRPRIVKDTDDDNVEENENKVVPKGVRTKSIDESDDRKTNVNGTGDCADISTSRRGRSRSRPQKAQEMNQDDSFESLDDRKNVSSSRHGRSKSRGKSLRVEKKLKEDGEQEKNGSESIMGIIDDRKDNLESRSMSGESVKSDQEFEHVAVNSRTRETDKQKPDSGITSKLKRKTFNVNSDEDTVKASEEVGKARTTNTREGIGNENFVVPESDSDTEKREKVSRSKRKSRRTLKMEKNETSNDVTVLSEELVSKKPSQKTKLSSETFQIPGKFSIACSDSSNVNNRRGRSSRHITNVDSELDGDWMALGEETEKRKLGHDQRNKEQVDDEVEILEKLPVQSSKKSANNKSEKKDRNEARSVKKSKTKICMVRNFCFQILCLLTRWHFVAMLLSSEGFGKAYYVHLQVKTLMFVLQIFAILDVKNLELLIGNYNY